MWGWYLWTPLIAIFVLHLPWIIAVGEMVIFRTKRVYWWFDSVGIVKLLDPIYKQTVERLF